MIQVATRMATRMAISKVGDLVVVDSAPIHCKGRVIASPYWSWIGGTEFRLVAISVVEWLKPYPQSRYGPPESVSVSP